MSITTFFSLWVVGAIFVCVAILVGAFVFLKRKGVFSRAIADAKATASQGAADAASKITNKIDDAVK